MSWKNVQTFGIESLEESLVEIDHFFANYDMEYAAAEVDHAFLDYQLAEAVPLDFVGLNFYERYLRNLAAEVFFITYIPETQIVELLNVYQEKLGFDYRRDINNLFDCVFKQFVGKHSQTFQHLISFFKKIRIIREPFLVFRIMHVI